MARLDHLAHGPTIAAADGTGGVRHLDDLAAVRRDSCAAGVAHALEVLVERRLDELGLGEGNPLLAGVRHARVLEDPPRPDPHLAREAEVREQAP